MSRTTRRSAGRHRVHPKRLGAATLLGVCLVTAWAIGRPIHAADQQARASSAAPASAGSAALFTRYCLTCHNETMKSRGTVPVAFDKLDAANVATDTAAWERIVRKMRAGVMPPAGAPHPDKAERDAFLVRVEGDLDRLAAAVPNPGRTEPLHRLNRTEYRNAIRDLLDLDVDVSSLLPADDVSYGFDNIAGVLKLSPTLMERYLAAAQKISRLAVGTAPPAPSIDYYRVADDLSQDVHLPGLPLGTRGGTKITYAFPMDAEYEIRPRLTRDLNESVPAYLEAQELEVSIDGARVGLFTLPGVTPPSAPGGRGGGRGGARGAAPPATPASSTPDPSTDDPPDPQAPAISQIAQGVRAGPREREQRNRADEKWNLRIPVKAGEREVVVTFLNRTSALDETTRLPFLRPYPAGVNIPETRLGAYLRSVEIVGPLVPSGAGHSASRERVFTCTPGTQAAEASCARTILTTLARRAYRRPVTERDVEPLLAFYREGRSGGSFDAGIERAVRRLVVSPEFLFRIERDPAGIVASTPYAISDVELASRLSFFLWSSIPDDELLRLAEKRQLATPAVLGQQVRRMLADPRADAFMVSFAGQWLFLRNLDAVVPVQSVFPDFDDTLRQAFRRETELFFESIVREDRSALDLLRADYTFLNERLARHYGIANVKGSRFRRVTLGKDDVRAGILGQGSVLTVTSYPDRTSPVVRGKWILENLLGTPPPPPLPNVGDLKPKDASGAVLSMRQRMEQHRANPICASCHSMMDPLGLSLENFDAIGRWRTLGESSVPIDASGALPDGTRFTGPAGLREALLSSDRFVATLTEKLLTYALGRGLESYDAPAVRAILRDASRGDYRMSSIVEGVVMSAPFRMRRAGGEAPR